MPSCFYDLALSSILCYSLCSGLAAMSLGAQGPLRNDSIRHDASRSPATSSASGIRNPAIGVTFSAAIATNGAGGSRIDRQFFELALNLGWRLAGTRNVALEYVPAVIPIAITTHDANYQYVPHTCSTDLCEAYLGGGRSIVTYHTVYGAGVSPLGLDLHLLRRSFVSIIIGAEGGMLWFTRAVPQNDAAKFNFTAVGRAGIQFRTGRHSALRVGYAYHHTSNAHSGAANPGLNSSMLTVSVIRDR